ncbi:lysophospholipid acyltransferase family protein [Hydrogenimonas sp.]
MRLKQLFFALLIRPLLLFVSGIRVRGLERLPAEGPALLVANHNSHLDTLALMSLFPLRTLPRVRPVAARDYFFATPLRRFVAQKLIGILPLERQRVQKSAGHPLKPLAQALDEGNILILYPEGSRGEPGELRPFKSGFAHLAKMRPEVPVIPVKISGTDRSLPKDEALWVPFILDIEILEPMRFHGSVRDFVHQVENLYNTPKETP